MWALDNYTRYAADRTWIRDAEGAEIWIVAVKATYEMLPDGRTRIAPYQIPVNHGVVRHADGVSPIFETDLGPTKAATDVWLTGHAWSQSGEPVKRIRVAFSVGPVQREIMVHGDREWEWGLLNESTSPAQPFTRMPLTWARACGGDGPDCSTGNPVGMGFLKRADGQRPVPNLEHPGRAFTNKLVTHPTMGVGPIPRHWPTRRKYAGTYDAKWRQTRAPLQAADLDARHWQVAPVEQQVPGRLKGGEQVTLLGLTPPGFANDGLYHCLLPKLSLGFQTRFFDSRVANSRSTIHSVILQPDGVKGSGPLVSVVHHMALPCHDRVNLLDCTAITEKKRPLDKPDTTPESDAALIF